ncbi:hypothetical protein EGW08_012759, partial [Elysia chlorotica]
STPASSPAGPVLSNFGGKLVNTPNSRNPSLSGGLTAVNDGSSSTNGGSQSGNSNGMPVSFIPKGTSSLNNVNSNGNSNNNNNNNNNNNIINNSGTGSTVNRCSQRSFQDFRPHAVDCSKFSVCTLGHLVDLDCPQGSVFHSGTSSCVPRSSAYDLCTRARRACPPGFSGKTPDPHHCARFFHCDRPAQRVRWEEHHQECPYPQLFNVNTLQCEHFSSVDCGTREEPRDPCEYLANSCDGHVLCVPCAVRFPSCRGRRDGINAWAGRRGSPDYVVCSQQRVLYHGRCDQRGGRPHVFDEMSGACVSKVPMSRRP